MNPAMKIRLISLGFVYSLSRDLKGTTVVCSAIVFANLSCGSVFVSKATDSAYVDRLSATCDGIDHLSYSSMSVKFGSSSLLVFLGDSSTVDFTVPQSQKLIRLSHSRS